MATTPIGGTVYLTPEESDLINVDMAQLFGTAETLTAGTSILTNRRTGLAVTLGGAATISDFYVQQRVGPLPVGIYHLRVRATGSGGNTRGGIAVLRVID